MNILVVSSYVPYPLYSGGQVRLYNLIRELSQRHEITLLCEKRSKQAVSTEDIAALKKICKEVIIVNAPKQWSIKNVIRSGFSSRSFLLTGHTHTEMQEKIRNLLEKQTFDVVHVETFYVMQNVKIPLTSFNKEEKRKFPPVVLAEHNIEYLVYERFMQRAPAIARPLLKIDIAKIRREEEAAWRQATKLVAVSVDDKKIMEQSGFNPIVVANGVNTDQFTFKNIKKSLEAKEKKILFIGDFKWIQNRDAVAWIIQEVWPLIREKYKNVSGKRENERIQNLNDKSNNTDSGPSFVSKLRTGEQTINIKLWIVGRTIPDSVKSLSKEPDILFDEKNSSRPTHELFQEAAVLLAPIRVGGGTSYKILESTSSGTPAVITSLSANALQAKDGQEVMVGDTPEELAEKTVSLLQNDELYEKIAKNGRAFIEKHYTWKEIAKVLEEVYVSIV
jgi:glycosyltransferase involved in cell wall biosynthesis